jgi:hypothetical protein
VLETWGDLPGSREDGTPDSERLRAWISEARAALEEVDRAKHGDYLLGRLLVRSPVGSDGAWPHEAVRDAIERLASDAIDEHLRIEIINSRGVYTKGRLEGGDQERSLARRYESFADRMSPHWPRTADVLYGVAEHYQRWARSSDSDAELREDL